YYFGWVSAKLFGLRTYAIRFVPAAFGLLTVGLVLTLRRRLGNIGALAAAAILALSPGAVYLSRYFIHESLLVCFTLALVVAFERFATSGRRSFFLLAAAFAALMCATKETALISIGTVILAGGLSVCLLQSGLSRRLTLHHIFHV